jgi:beta-glucosidase
MINFFVDLLTPIFNSMGVSAADVQTTADSLSGYIYAIVALLVVAIVVMVAAHWVVKKGSRALVRTTSVVAWIAITTIVVNSICFGPMYTTISAALADGYVLSDETSNNSKDIVKEVSEEGIVLAKNEGLLPLSEDTTKLNVFGWASTNPIYGGTGSGSSDSSSCTGILESLETAGYTLNTELSDFYTEYCSERPSISMQAQDWTLPEPTADSYSDELISNAKEFSDVALIVISRSGGEGADLPRDMKAVIDGTYNANNDSTADPVKANYCYTNASYTNNGSYDDFEEGQTYLELSKTEKDMVDLVCSNFDKVAVVINGANTMELGWVEEYDQIQSVLLVPGTGVTGMLALGEIINGEVNPSGKTVDTYVYDLTSTPTFNNVGDMQYTNLDDYRAQILEADSAYEGAIGFVNYVEGIYVGYKFYETAAEEGLLDFDEAVQYPFGYGLSYTTFTQEMGTISESNGTISFDVTVTNTGDVAGKDVVEVYYNPPYTNGGIEKSSANLIAFDKTDALEPGTSQTISFSFNEEDMASYDEGIKVEGGGYILEAGDYKISIRTDSHNIISEQTYTVDSDVIYTDEYDGARSTDQVAATNEFADTTEGDVTFLSRADGFANYEEAVAAPSEDAYVMSDEVRETLLSNATYNASDYDDPSDEMPTTGANNGIVLADMTGLSYDDEKWDDLLDELTYEDMQNLIAWGGWMTAEVSSIEKVAGSDPDGPAGLSNFISGNYGTAYTAEILLAMTWNKDLATKVGDGISTEFVETNCEGWYGPAMNTHRNAFAGRNFEYYSEDGVLAGQMAAAEVAAAEANGVMTYIKHFALNDQETSRCSFLLTWANEQSIREIYLKPFEYAVKQGGSSAAMSSFNFFGTTPACANSSLLNDVLRGEWGFVGMVNTDFFGGYGYMSADRCIANGNDMMLGLGTSQYSMTSIESATMVKNMRNASHNILYTTANHGSYVNGTVDNGMDTWIKIFIGVDVVIAVLLIALEAFVIIRYRKRKSEIVK